MGNLTEKQMIFMARNTDLFHDKNGKSILSKKHKEQFDIFMFGEEFMESANKGSKVIYNQENRKR